MIEARAPLLIDKIPPTMTRRNKERRGVTCDLDCSQILQLKERIAFLFTENRTVWTWPIKPSRDPVTYLVKYYPALQKTAKGNLTSKKETFFFRHFVPLFTAHCTGINDQSFRRLSRDFATRRKFRLHVETSWSKLTCFNHQFFSVVFLTGICLWWDAV